MTRAKQVPKRRLRLGIVGGGRPGSIGPTHRRAALMDGHWDVVAGAFSRNPEVGRATGRDWLMDEDRIYTDYQSMAESEARRPDRIDAVTICTYNTTHYEIAAAFLDRGFHVICDKPLTTTAENAADLAQRARKANVIFALTHAFSACPMVRQAREMIAAGELGKIRSVATEFVSEYQADAPSSGDWQNNPELCGPLGAVANCGTHVFHLLEYVTGLKVNELSADLASLVPGHRLDDHATLHLRFDNGARGFLWNTTIAPGNENGLSIRVFGSKGGLEWWQEHPNHMRYTPINGTTQILTRGGPKASPAAQAVTRVPSGHPEGYLEAFANLYTEVAAAIIAREHGPTSTAKPPFPTVDDGVRGVAFMLATLQSSRDSSRFVALEDFIL